MTPLDEDLLEYLRRKRIAMSRGRIVLDHRGRHEADVLASLAVLVRKRSIFMPRAGEYQATELERIADQSSTPPATAAGFPSPPMGRPAPAAVEVSIDARGSAEDLARELPAVLKSNEGEIMATRKKKCATCEIPKGATGFAKGSEVCRLCVKSGTPASSSKTAAPEAAKRIGGRFADVVANLRAEAAELLETARRLEAL